MHRICIARNNNCTMRLSKRNRFNHMILNNMMIGTKMNKVYFRHIITSTNVLSSQTSKKQFINTTPIGNKKNISSDTISGAYEPAVVEASWYDWWEQSGFFKPSSTISYNNTSGKKVNECINDNTINKPFSMVIPPPNITGSLHMGHALTVSIEDAIIRWQRMRGITNGVVWIPGSDHAGIATQVVVEKHLMKTEGVDRHHLGRDEFTNRVWEWKEKYGSTIKNQLRRLGASLDWSREVFTLDKERSEAVVEAFVRLYDAKLISRASRLVNWDCSLKTAVSDIEIESLELKGRTRLSVKGHPEKKKYEFGVMTDFAYKVAETEEEIIVSTTRIETMLGDVAVAVHPDDPRYKHLHGLFVVHPFTGTYLPIVCDEKLVDMSVGTGAVKITPAHDPADFECALRNNLPFVNIMDDEGRITLNELENVSFPISGSNTQREEVFFDQIKDRIEGLPRFDARETVMKLLEEYGLIRGSRDHSMTLHMCSRSQDIIEPRIKMQWWLNAPHLAASAVQVLNFLNYLPPQEQYNAVEDGHLDIIPKRYESVWKQWLGAENYKPWCISRQLWWGHRIPAYKVILTSHADVDAATASSSFPSSSTTPNEDIWVIARNHAEARIKGIQTLRERGLLSSTEREEEEEEEEEEGRVILEQDPDVLDTWFSSGLFPFAACGWPNDTESFEYSQYYPNTLLETGEDILFFWVGRMVMLGTQLTGKLPFSKVLLHPMVRDAKGKKMSKSLGNVIDPIDVIEGIHLEDMHKRLTQSNLDPKEIKLTIASQKQQFPQGISECGTDATRMALCSYFLHTNQSINFDTQKAVSFRHFCNKLWNVTKFSLIHFGEEFKPSNTLPPFNYTTSSHKSDSEGEGQYSLMNQWILSRLHDTTQLVNNAFTSKQLGHATNALYDFWLYEVCDVYIESIKPILWDKESSQQERDEVLSTLHYCLHSGLRMLHPFMPFVTEELYQHLPRYPQDKESIMISQYPLPEHNTHFRNNIVEQQVQDMQRCIYKIRHILASYNVKKSAKPPVFIKLDGPFTKNRATTLSSLAPVIATLAYSSEVKVIQGRIDDNTNQWVIPSDCAVDVIDEGCEIHVDIKDYINVEEELRRLDKALEKINKQIGNVEKQMARPSYTTRVPENVKAAHKDTLERLKLQQRNTLEIRYKIASF